MTIGDFIDKTKVTISNDLISYVIDGFLKSNLAFYKPNSSLMLYLETDKNNRGKVNSADVNNFVNSLMLDKLKNKYGVDNYHLVSEEKRLKDSLKEIDRINTAFKKNYFVKITKDGVIGEAGIKYDHTFIINTMPENYVEILSGLYEQIRELKLDDVAILACSPNYAGLGYTAPIKINCSVEALETIMKMLDNMKHSFTSKTKKVLPIYDRFNTWYGYDQYDSYNEVDASAIFTMAIFQAIQHTFDAYLDQAVEINGVLIKDYYENKPNKLQAMRDIIANSIALEDAFLANVILNTRNELAAFGLTATNILNVPIVEARMKDFYGYEELDEYDSSLDADIIAKEIISEMVSNDKETKEEDVAEVIPVNTSIVIEEPLKNGDEKKEDLKDDEIIEEDSHDSDEVIEVNEPKIETIDVKEELQKASVQSKENISKEDLHNPDKLEYTNPDSHCLEYQLKDGLLIPDLADIAYNGDSLKEALSSGGYETGFEYIRDVASHFHYDYKGSNEDNQNMLEILRNPSRYYFDGTLKEEFQESIPKVEEVAENLKEQVEKQPELGEELVIRTKEEARDEDILSSIGGEITKAVQSVVEEMRQAARQIPVVEGVFEVDDKQYQELANDLDKKERQQQYQALGEELEGNTLDSTKKVDEISAKEEALIAEQTSSILEDVTDNPVSHKDLNKVDDQNYFVNAGYLMQFANDFDEKRVDRDKLTPDELEALKQTSMATLTSSLNRLVDAIKVAEEEKETKEDKIVDERYAKYAYLVDNLDNLNKKIKNSDQTVLEYFEEQEIEKNVKGDEILNFHDHSKKTIKQFVNEHLINYLVNFGSHELSYILALYADSIEEPEVVKK